MEEFINIVLIISLSLIGVSLGSFFTSFSYRYINNISYKDNKYSFCKECKTRLKAIDLIPILSYLFLRGRCRYCKKKIDPRNFYFELFSLIYFLFALVFYIYIEPLYYLNPYPYIYLFKIFISYLLIVASYIDLKKYEVPYLLLIIISLLCILEYIYKCIYSNDYLLVNILGFTFILSLFILIYLVFKIIFKKEGIGIADIIILSFLGLSINIFNIIILLLFTSLFALIYYFIVLIIKKKKENILPLVPFILGGYLFIIFIGEYIINLVIVI